MGLVLGVWAVGDAIESAIFMVLLGPMAALVLGSLLAVVFSTRRKLIMQERKKPG